MKKFNRNKFLHFFGYSLILISVFLLMGCGAPSPTPAETESFVNDPTATSVPTWAPTATQEPTPEPTRTIEVNVDALDGVTVRFFHPWGGQAAETLETIATQFSLTNPYGIWVNVEAMGSEEVLVGRLIDSLESGDVPGLVALHPYNLSMLEDEFFTVNMTNYVDDPEWGLSAEAQADIPDVFIEPFTAGDELIALPVAPQAAVIFYNQTWAEALGFASVPVDQAAFRQQACGATFANLDDSSNENDGTGGWIINRDPAALASWYVSFEGELPLAGALKFNTAAGQASFNYLKNVYDEGCFWIGRQADPYYYFANRYALMYAGRLDQLPAQAGWMKVAESQDEWKVMGYPGADGEVMIIDGPGLMLTADTPEQQLAAWLFAKHLLEPEVQAALVRSLFTLPVRTSAMTHLEDLAAEYPQWAQGVDLIDRAVPLPISQAWGIGQWVLQDAIARLLPSETNETDAILQELDRMLDEFETGAP